MDAKLERSGPRYTLVVERRLPHSPEKVWRVLTEGDLLGKWFPCDIEGEWIVGTPLRFAFRHGEDEGMSEEDLRGEVLAVDEPRRLEFRWGSHVVIYEIEPDGDGSRFVLSDIFDDPSWGARQAAGWEMCLENIELVLDAAAVLKFAASVWTGKFKRYAKMFEERFGPQHDPTGEHPLLKGEGR